MLCLALGMLFAYTLFDIGVTSGNSCDSRTMQGFLVVRLSYDYENIAIAVIVVVMPVVELESWK